MADGAVELDLLLGGAEAAGGEEREEGEGGGLIGRLRSGSGRRRRRSRPSRPRGEVDRPGVVERVVGGEAEVAGDAAAEAGDAEAGGEVVLAVVVVERELAAAVGEVEAPAEAQEQHLEGVFGEAEAGHVVVVELERPAELADDERSAQVSAKRRRS
ncbi:MAG: hypothetical protein H6705_10835 [Myxococcales bacterium]|nr:hypothetical protein [Myxococcales bacterium]